MFTMVYVTLSLPLVLGTVEFFSSSQMQVILLGMYDEKRFFFFNCMKILELILILILEAISCSHFNALKLGV